MTDRVRGEKNYAIAVLLLCFIDFPLSQRWYVFIFFPSPSYFLLSRSLAAGRYFLGGGGVTGGGDLVAGWDPPR